MNLTRSGLLIGTAVALLALSPCVTAQDSEKRSYDLPAQDLRYALRSVARDAGFQLIADTSILRGKQAAPLKGDYVLEEAVTRLLEGTGLTLEINGGTLFVRGREEPSRAAIATAGDNIVVTGSRIRGAATASKTTSMSRDSMTAAGLGTLAEAVQTIPQNFSGGQNPGVGFNVPEGLSGFPCVGGHNG